MLDVSLLNQIYCRLGDQLSKEIFKNRLMYSISRDPIWIYENIKSTKYGFSFLQKMNECKTTGEIVIFGAGVWGKDLYQVTKEYPWKYFIDSKPKLLEYEGLPVISYKDFINNYKGEYIFISSRIYHREMYEQLIHDEIPAEKIVNVGKMLDNLAKDQYFDLEFMKPAENGEIFVDVGSFDGMTSVYFNDWSHGDSYVYAFEPDPENAEKCHDNLESRHISHEVIKKGVWSDDAMLHFRAVANGTSSISDMGGTAVEVTSLDQALEGKEITFIKMDIEGAEYRALIGARNVIVKNTPKLAISIYHKPEDIWELPKIIMEYCPNYRFYLRHYSLTDYETVLYAICES